MRGSTSAILQPDGSLIKGYEYDEFGNLEQSGDAGFLNDVTFTGSVSDTSTGLQYMNARYYNPKTGRFLSRDTYSGNPYDPWTQHLYAYCGNNPTNMIDPTGHFWYYKGHQVSNDTTWAQAQEMFPDEPVTPEPDGGDDDPGHSNPNGRLTDEQIAENATIIYNYLRDEYGWSHNAACAALGNMQAENDTLDPGRRENNNGPGWGLCQWTPYTNPDTGVTCGKYLQWAPENGYANDSMKGQLKYLNYSMAIDKLAGDYRQYYFKNTKYQINADRFKISEESIDYLTKAFGSNYIKSGGILDNPDYDWVGTPKKPGRVTYANNWDTYFRENGIYH